MNRTEAKDTLQMSPFWRGLSEQEQTDLIRGLTFFNPYLFQPKLIGLEV